MAKKRLGRGLDELLGDARLAYDNDIEVSKEGMVDLSIDAIKPNPYQPRKVFDEGRLQELANSIQTQGLLQPIIVIEDIDGYMLVAGERRLRASKMIGLETIKSYIVDIDKSKYREVALIENIQREDLNIIELAKSLQALLGEYNMTHEELAKIIHKSRPYITNTLRLLNLIPSVQEMLLASEISSGHARVLVGLDEVMQKELAERTKNEQLSVHQLEQLKSALMKRNQNVTKKSSKTLDFSLLSEHFKSLGFKVRAKENKISIEFKNQADISKFLDSFS